MRRHAAIINDEALLLIKNRLFRKEFAVNGRLFFVITWTKVHILR